MKNLPSVIISIHAGNTRDEILKSFVNQRQKGLFIWSKDNEIHWPKATLLLVYLLVINH
jgi:hypothetical protein